VPPLQWLLPLHRLLLHHRLLTLPLRLTQPQQLLGSLTQQQQPQPSVVMATLH
jgi:hypothetical protein